MATIDFTKPKPDNRRYTKQVRTWVEDTLPDEFDCTVMVNEMQCFEPGCATLETVVTLLGEKSIIFKIFMPVAEVQLVDVTTSMQPVLAGNQEIQQHMTDADAGAFLCEPSDDMEE